MTGKSIESYQMLFCICMVMWFVSFTPLLWHIRMIDFHMLNHLCIPGTTPTLSCCTVPTGTPQNVIRDVTPLLFKVGVSGAAVWPYLIQHALNVKVF